MMTNANAAFDPIATATAIATNARNHAEASTNRRGTAAVIAMLTGVTLAVTASAAMLLSPTIPEWCSTHGCPTPTTIWQPHSSY